MARQIFSSNKLMGRVSKSELRILKTQEEELHGSMVASLHSGGSAPSPCNNATIHRCKEKRSSEEQ